MKILFMGTPDFSVPTLQALIDSKHEVIGVFTQPDKPKGRGHEMQPTPVKILANQYNIPIYQPKRVRNEEVIAEIKQLAPDLIVVIAFGQILPKSLLDIPPFGCINVHASLLPKYRGSAPIQWCVINGEVETGITTMMMDVGIDTGDMLLTKSIPLNPKETGGSLFDKLMVLGGPLLLETMELLEKKELVRIPQDGTLSTHAPMLSKTMGEIDWSKSATDIERLIRGLNPWPTAYAVLHAQPIKLWAADVIPSGTPENLDSIGTVVEILPKKGFVVQCGLDQLLLTEVQLQGKKRMSCDAFLRGYEVKIGDLLTIIGGNE